MVVANVEFIGEDGNVREHSVSSSKFSVEIDGEFKQPAIVSEVEIENDGDQAVARDQCGRVERRRQTNDGWAIRVTGIVTANDSRSGNLSLQTLRDVVANANTIEIVSDVESGEYTVSNTIITDASDLVAVQTADTDGKEQAFDFQLQLGDTESSD